MLESVAAEKTKILEDASVKRIVKSFVRDDRLDIDDSIFKTRDL